MILIGIPDYIFFYLSYFEETDEFIFLFLFHYYFPNGCYCDMNYYIYCFDKDFNINFSGIINSLF